MCDEPSRQESRIGWARNGLFNDTNSWLNRYTQFEFQYCDRQMLSVSTSQIVSAKNTFPMRPIEMAIFVTIRQLNEITLKRWTCKIYIPFANGHRLDLIAIKLPPQSESSRYRLNFLSWAMFVFLIIFVSSLCLLLVRSLCRLDHPSYESVCVELIAMFCQEKCTYMAQSSAKVN